MTPVGLVAPYGRSLCDGSCGPPGFPSRACQASLGGRTCTTICPTVNDWGDLGAEVGRDGSPHAACRASFPHVAQRTTRRTHSGLAYDSSGEG